MGERRDDIAVGALIDRQGGQLRWQGRRIPVVTGVGALEQAMACLRCWPSSTTFLSERMWCKERPSKPWAAMPAAFSSSAISPLGWAFWEPWRMCQKPSFIAFLSLLCPSA